MAVLFVAALEEETEALAHHTQVLHVGVGKVEAASRLARHLADHRDAVDLIVNVGTAGGLRGQPLGEVAEIGEVFQHDFDLATASAFVGRALDGGPLRLHGPAHAGARLASGDRLIIDADDRQRLAADADVVDMEGYAIAAVAARFDLPVRIAKAVSDSADADAAVTWPETLRICSAALTSWAQDEGLL